MRIFWFIFFIIMLILAAIYLLDIKRGHETQQVVDVGTISDPIKIADNDFVNRAAEGLDDGSNYDFTKTPENLDNPPEDAIVSESGLISIILQKGDEAEDKLTEDIFIRMHLTSWIQDSGELYKSTYYNGSTALVRPKDVNPALKEALLDMRLGEKRRVWASEDLTYQGKIGFPKGVIVYDVYFVDYN